MKDDEARIKCYYDRELSDPDFINRTDIDREQVQMFTCSQILHHKIKQECEDFFPDGRMRTATTIVKILCRYFNIPYELGGHAEFVKFLNTQGPKRTEEIINRHLQASHLKK